MEIINKYISLSGFPFDDLIKVSNLIEYDGPILSHYKAVNDKHYFFLWVDYNENFNRWMLWEVTAENIFNYLYARISLRQSLLKSSIVFFTDVDRNVNYKNPILVNVEDIPEVYLPEEDSNYYFDVPSIYENLTKDFSEDLYVQKLRKVGFVYKLQNQKEYLRYGSAVTAKNAGKSLMRIAESASAYAAYEFYHTYKGYSLFEKDIEKTIKQVNEVVDLLVSEVTYGSFEVVLSVDPIMGSDHVTLEGFIQWKRQIMQRYYEDVMSKDFALPETQDYFENRFTDSVLRKKIVKPIADILVNESLLLITTSPFTKAPIKHKSINKKIHKNLTSNKKDDKSEDPGVRKLYTLYVEGTEKNGKVSWEKKQIEEGLILQTETNSVELTLNILRFDNYEVLFKEPVKYFYSIDQEGYSSIDCPLYEIKVKGSSKREAINAFESDLASLIGSILDSKDDSIRQTFLDNFIEEIVII